MLILTFGEPTAWQLRLSGQIAHTIAILQVIQKNLTKMESQLQAARRIYNGDVTLYNTTISTFPNSFFASLFGFHEEELFVIEEYKKENVKIN